MDRAMDNGDIMGDLYLWRCTHCGAVFADLGRMAFDEGWDEDEMRGSVYLKSDPEDGEPDFRHTCGPPGGGEIERWAQVG